MALDTRPLRIRLAEHTRVDEETGCHLWEGYRVADGYGQLKVRGVAQRVHRIAWTLRHGPIAPELCVCHRCDTPNCINVDHLFLGTNAENQADKVRKGRHKGAPKGRQHPSAVLTEAEVRAIRASQKTQQAIADEYEVSRSLVGLIRAGQRWRHVS